MLITHDLAVLSEISDRIGIMYGGQMVEFGSSRRNLQQSKTSLHTRIDYWNQYLD